MNIHKLFTDEIPKTLDELNEEYDKTLEKLCELALEISKVSILEEVNKRMEDLLNAQSKTKDSPSIQTKARMEPSDLNTIKKL